MLGLRRMQLGAKQCREVVIAEGARNRDESRGAHYKPDFPERDDKNWLKTTKATFAPDADEPKFEFEAVDVSLIPPRPRRYDAVK